MTEFGRRSVHTGPWDVRGAWESGFHGHVGRGLALGAGRFLSFSRPLVWLFVWYSWAGFLILSSISIVSFECCLCRRRLKLFAGAWHIG